MLTFRKDCEDIVLKPEAPVIDEDFDDGWL